MLNVLIFSKKICELNKKKYIINATSLIHTLKHHKKQWVKGKNIFSSIPLLQLKKNPKKFIFHASPLTAAFVGIRESSSLDQQWLENENGNESAKHRNISSRSRSQGLRFINVCLEEMAWKSGREWERGGKRH